MDKFQALAVIGLDGPDSLSPKHEIAAEIDRLEKAGSNPLIKDRLESLRKMLATATEKGGFRNKA